MKKVYVGKNDKGKYWTDLTGSWTKDINKATVYWSKRDVYQGTPVLVNIVEAEDKT